jgi:acyl-[acyl-carrier-protein]-phospholipid O-acyltransferase/long-chain-fatty-acid--[acyl-carrier-protein] ligase
LAQITETPATWLWLSAVILGVMVVLFVLAGARFWDRVLLWLITHTVYRLRVSGRENVPDEGPALLVCNHVSYIDWLLLMASIRRPVRFVVWAPYLKMWGLRFLLRRVRAIPIDGTAGPREIDRALQAAGDALAKGELVCIFAEGRLTRNGFMLPFHRGFEKIAKCAAAPILPVCLDHLWGSIFSWRGGKMLLKWPQQLPYPVQVAFGKPLPSSAAAGEVRLEIQSLSAACALARSALRRPAHRQFVRVAARHPFAPCLTDSAGKLELSYGKTLAGAMILARQLRPILGDEKMVGVWLPPSVGAALANIALALLGKTAVNLNYTAGPDNLRSALRQCGIQHVLTAQTFTGRGYQLPADAQAIYLESFRDKVTNWQRLRAFLAVVLLPAFVLDRWVLGLHKHQSNDLATVIFSSGSTGEPKGVMLTHQNIMANAESMIQAIDVDRHDRILGILPFFHSFGYTVTLWLPLLVGALTVYHYDPRQAEKVGELTRKHRCTIMLTTPTFLRFYIRRCQPEDFASLRILICGAEKLPPGVARDFQEKFRQEVLEGYGCTELSPAACVNVPDVEINGLRQVGNKPGTIGQPLPGVAGRIVHPETFELLPIGEEGLLLIYGANVMKGYLGRPELTKEAVRDGWYVTGDIARFDEDGFVTITGRLSRFAKIGGEMVPLEKIEEELHGIMGTSERICAVAAVPDPKKGERLIVLHLPMNGFSPTDLCVKLNRKGLPNLWVPGERDFYPVNELPVLGSGKLDLCRLKEMALEKINNKRSA